MVSRKATMRSRSTATNRYDDIFALCLTLVNKPFPPSLPPNINRRKLFALPSDNISSFRLSISLDPLSTLSLSPSIYILAFTLVLWNRDNGRRQVFYDNSGCFGGEDVRKRNKSVSNAPQHETFSSRERRGMHANSSREKLSFARSEKVARVGAASFRWILVSSRSILSFSVVAKVSSVPGNETVENSARFHFSKGFVFVDYDHEAGTWVNTDSFAFSCRASAEKKDGAEGRGGRRRKEKRDGKSRGFDFNETREASRTNRD